MIRSKKNQHKPIDFVITWVDNSDLVWQKEYSKYAFNDKTLDTGIARYRDWGILKYWFRAVEENAPWVRKIHFVTYGHVPKWLDIKHPKLHIVRHNDLIEKKYLPTFNSCAIEVNMHKIPGLSEQFVYFNDDMFINKPVSPGSFFKNSRPRASYVFTPLRSTTQADRIRANCNQIGKKYKSKHNFKPFNIKNGLPIVGLNIFFSMKKPSGFTSKHAPASYLKSSFIDLVKKEGRALQLTTKHKFRTDTDCSQWVFEYYQLYTGLSLPRVHSFSKYYDLKTDYLEASGDIASPNHSLICLNDTDSSVNIELPQTYIHRAFEKRYPHRSSFERSA